MTCETIRGKLEDYHDRELGRVAAADVEAHLETCAECRADLAQLEIESAVYARYDRRLEPDRDRLWQGILERIDIPSPVSAAPGWRLRLGDLVRLLASSVTPSRLVPLTATLALVVVGFASWRVLWPEAEPQAVDRASVPARSTTVPGPPAGDVASAKPTRSDEHLDVAAPPSGPSSPRPRRVRPRATEPPTLPAPVQKAEDTYLQAISVLTKDIERSSTGSHPGLRDELQKPLGDIDRSIRTARQAVIANPDDPAAVVDMLAAYDTKVEALQTLARLQTVRNR